MLIFEISSPRRQANSLVIQEQLDCDLPAHMLREDSPLFPECSELDVVRHYTNLAQQKNNFSIDTNMYPLGSCTMKYNPRIASSIAKLEAFTNVHPYAPVEACRGSLEILYELQQHLKIITGMHSVCLNPMAGAHGEFAGIAMIKAYHESRQDFKRTVMLVPDSAHGTNPASAVKCGFSIQQIPTNQDGHIDLTALKAAVNDHTAGIMLTNPSTLGLFENDILKVKDIIHKAGGLMYYDGANLNALLGIVRPYDMGFDVMHMNLHKTFATPHGGGGPGAGPIACSARLAPFLPIPIVLKKGQQFSFATQEDFPQSIGRLSTFYGNFGVLLRAYIYISMLGQEGLKRVAQFAVLNANYLQKRLQDSGFTLAYPQHLASHEFIVTLAPEKKKFNIAALDVAKRLLDHGFYAPTIYFPLLIEECMLIEPTETESRETLDRFVNVMRIIFEEIQDTPEILQTAPHNLQISRPDEALAARQLDIKYVGQAK